MKTYLLHIWDYLKTSYWFIPTLMCLLAFALALILIEFDHQANKTSFEDTQILFLGGAEGARSLLSSVAGSIITVAGVVFSITIATLTQASSQFGPRLLRNFMRDRGNQIVLGTFVSTFLYCLAVLRTVHGANEGFWDEFVPHISVTVAVALAILSIAVLIYFIHHVSASLQAPAVVANVANDLNSGVDRIFPERLGEGEVDPGDDPPPGTLPGHFESSAVPVFSKRSGYLQAIDNDGILKLCGGEDDLIIELLRRPGDFVIEGQALARVYPRAKCDDAIAGRIREKLYFGVERTSEQDVEFAIDQLVEIAVRSLSPGINDPFTAMQCIDWLGHALVKLGQRRFPSRYRFDQNSKKLCVIARISDVDGVIDASFDQIRQYGADSVAVTARLLETLCVLGAEIPHPRWRREFVRHAEMIYAQAKSRFAEPHDLDAIRRRYDAAISALTQTD
jgi:uncharacterized membrane protein